MLDVEFSTAFKKEVKRAMLQGRDVLKMFVPVAALLNPPQYQDHPLKGEWKGYRDFHFERTGTHSELFGK